jgi:hypothetical protein
MKIGGCSRTVHFVNRNSLEKPSGTAEQDQRLPKSNQVRFPHPSTPSPRLAHLLSLETAMPTDYLTCLPADVLEWIWELVKFPHRERFRPALVCRTFVPIGRKRVFTTTHCFGIYKFKRACKVLRDSGATRDIEELYISFNYEREEAGADLAKTFVKLLKLMPNLIKLTISHAMSLTDVFLSDPRIRRLTTSLVRLNLEVPVSAWSAPYDPARFSSLRQLKKLSVFRLDIEKRNEFIPDGESIDLLKVDPAPGLSQFVDR